MFKKLKVATRLSLSFGAAVLLGVVIAAIAAFQMSQLSGQLDEIANDRMVKVQKFTMVKDNLNAMARYARNILISSDPALEDGEKKKILDLRAQNGELLAALDKVIVLPKGRELFNIIQKTRPLYNAAVDEALALDATGDKEAAAKLLLGKSREIQQALFNSVDESNALQQAVAAGLAATAKAEAARATTIMVALAIAMAVMGVSITWLLVRNLSRALGAEPAELGAVAQRVAAGDLSSLRGGNEAHKGSVLASLAAMQVSLAGIVGQVRASSDSIATGSAQIATGNADLSQRTEEQASNLQQTAASMEQISSTVKASAETAGQADKLASEASAAALKGGEMVGGVISTMQDIAASSKKIADIIGVIDGIAFQTNILALNAAVEAARAGEQGRGFAVVASEVRSLAGRSAQAAKEIKTLIGASVNQVEAGTRQVNDAGISMSEIVSQVQRVSQLLKELSGAAAEQSLGVAQVGDAVAQLDQVTQQNAALVEESAAAADSLKQQAATLAEVVRVFQVGGGDTMPGGSSIVPAATRAPVVQRRAPTRAIDVARPAFKPKATPAHQSSAVASSAMATTATDDWSSF